MTQVQAQNSSPMAAPGSPAHGWLKYRIGSFSLEARWEVEPSQFLVLFGPSGAGKTTLLRAIAGLTRPHEGSISVGGRQVFDSAAGLFVPPHQRRLGFLTQGYQLFPHQTVVGNIGYGLVGWSPQVRRERVAELVELFQLGGIEDRRPDQISGGQQQRTALARALAPRPELMLLDEPFNSLDLELRRELRVELREGLRAAGIPTIMVTHDIEEVVSLADQVQVMANGRLEPPGNPLTILGQPGQSRLARLVGVENLLQLTVASLHPQDGTMVCSGPSNGALQLEVPLSDVGQGDRVTVGIRASDIILASAEPVGSSARNRLPGTVTDVRLRPPGYEVSLDCSGPILRCHITGASLGEMGISPGDRLWAVFKASSCFLVREDNP